MKCKNIDYFNLSSKMQEYVINIIHVKEFARSESSDGQRYELDINFQDKAVYH
jgi:hypothetical protein